ncbi:hypothetical protein B9Z55_025850 [Caenorhabditis nigoni]|uniref:SPK domain-containing protein n=1 Tax=Caenorhabditis nigoni TaxID=1611254 RepID=A0A2G5T0Q2_9PELO|nr:hypothetical protein B9Z55_025850 [Caenorhabditis nigoni]
MSSIMSEKYEQCLKYISSNIENYTKPEVFKLWVADAVENVADLKDVTKTSKNFYKRVNVQLREIEDNDDHSLKEKFQMVFIFSRAVSNDFVKSLTDSGYKVKLNEKNVIIFVESNDKTFSRSSAHRQNDLHFKGKPVLNRRYWSEKVVSGNGQRTTPTTQNSQNIPKGSVPLAQVQRSGRSSSKRAQARVVSPTMSAPNSKRTKPASPPSPSASLSPYRTPLPPRVLPMTYRSTDSQTESVKNQHAITQTFEAPARETTNASTMTAGLEEQVINGRQFVAHVWCVAGEFDIPYWIKDFELLVKKAESNGHVVLTADEFRDLVSAAVIVVRTGREPANNNNVFGYDSLKMFLEVIKEELVEPLDEENLLEESLKFMDKEIRTFGASTDRVSREKICYALELVLKAVIDKK